MIDLEKLHSEIYSTRLLIFMETEPQSNKYNQIIFTPEQFKEISLKLSNLFPYRGKKGNLELFEIKESEEEYTLPDLKEFE